MKCFYYEQLVINKKKKKIYIFFIFFFCEISKKVKKKLQFFVMFFDLFYFKNQRGELLVDMWKGKFMRSDPKRPNSKDIPWEKNTMTNTFSISKAVTNICVIVQKK